MPTSPPALTPAPASPDRSDSATFSARAIALDDWTKNFLVPELQVAINSAYNNAVEAGVSATTAGAILWVSGTTYAIGNVRTSPLTALPYRRKTAGAGTTDPSLDGTNWVLGTLGTDSVTRSARTANTILIEQDRGSIIDITSGTFSQTFTAAATLGSGWYCYIRNGGTGLITLDPNAAELINGASTLIAKPGQTLLTQSDGVGLNAVVIESLVGDHSATVHTGNGHGSTNTVIRRFTTTQATSGTAITYADSATLGASFTINLAGLYAISYIDAHSAATVHGISLNSAQLTTGIQTITAANRLGATFCGAGLSSFVSAVAILAVGDVVRPHTQGTNSGNGASDSYFSIRRVGA